ncbi:hypothetical protein SBA7_950034 [Candidatus Sulfotelmatobacter sp. SbA7]|nr:hypothetical protein SBA7_950034 [Candidatus Sulfotelmatobacter sp. SbA7]
MQDVTADFGRMKAESDALAARPEAGKQAEKPDLSRACRCCPNETRLHRRAY